MTAPSEFDFDGLRMYASVDAAGASLFISIASGHAEFEVKVPLAEKDLQVLRTNTERSALLQAALHHPFQLRETALSEVEQRGYLDIILHAPVADVEAFLTSLDQGLANGAISSMLRITRGRNLQAMRSGAWFA
jgi:hypothetical protein